jgi:glutamine amidotransferase
MCDLFGMSCNSPDRATKSLPLFAEYSKEMYDGWGIAYYEGSEAKVIKNEDKAKKSDEFFPTVRRARSNVIISHLRKTTGSAVCKRNCHPFEHKYFDKEWVFAHNGYVGGIPVHPRARGDTDSESVFLYLMDEVVDYTCRAGIRGIYPGLKNAIKKLFDEFGTNINLNFMLSNGNLQFIFSHYHGKRIRMLRRQKNYGGAVLTSTRKLTDDNWEKIPKDSLLVLENGEILVISDSLL